VEATVVVYLDFLVVAITTMPMILALEHLEDKECKSAHMKVKL